MKPDATETENAEATPNWEVNHCKHNDGLFSLNIELEDRHVSCDTFAWSHKRGYHIKLAIFDLTHEDIKALGEALIAEAITITLKGAK